MTKPGCVEIFALYLPNGDGGTAGTDGAKKDAGSADAAEARPATAGTDGKVDTSADRSWTTGNYRGNYYIGFEMQAFTPCDLAEAWKVSVDHPPIFASLPQVCRTTNTPPRDLCIVYLDVDGRVSSPGRFQGQTGPVFDRELMIDRINVMAVGFDGDCLTPPNDMRADASAD